MTALNNRGSNQNTGTRRTLGRRRHSRSPSQKPPGTRRNRHPPPNNEPLITQYPVGYFDGRPPRQASPRQARNAALDADINSLVYNGIYLVKRSNLQFRDRMFYGTYRGMGAGFPHGAVDNDVFYFRNIILLDPVTEESTRQFLENVSIMRKNITSIRLIKPPRGSRE